MIIKFSLLRLFLIILLVILFPLVQKQWLNLYLFNINNFSIYKVLYYLSGLIVPILVIINSLNKFTYYKFNNNNNNNNNNNISGKLLLIITVSVLTLLSILISTYIFINLNIFINFFSSNKDFLVDFDINKYMLFVLIISFFLLLKKTKIVLKKIILTNFFVFSLITWYSEINDTFSINLVQYYNYKFENINFLNLTLLLAIETVFYLWSYISCNSNLSDWKVPKPYRREILPIFSILMFYLLIIFYYSILSVE